MHTYMLFMVLQAMGIQRYMFFSIHNCDKHPEVPLMQMKTCTEQYLKDSGLNYTIFRLCGFMQVTPCRPVFACYVCQDGIMLLQHCLDSCTAKIQQLLPAMMHALRIQRT